MIRLLAKWLIKQAGDDASPAVRQAYLRLCSAVDIALNLALFGGKCLCGTLSGSAAVLADGFNNLADAFTSLFTLFGFALAGIGAGIHHPYGHGRVEWLMSLVSSMAIVRMGISLGQNALHSIRQPNSVTMDAYLCVALLLSIAVKLYMFLYHRDIGRRVDSTALRATAADCVGDMASTSAILLSLSIERATGWHIDGYCGLLVSGFIVCSGGHSLIEVVIRILGEAPAPEWTERVRRLIEPHPEILSVSQLAIHDYGIGRFALSLHLEGCPGTDRAALEAIARDLSHGLYEQYDCDTTIQIDIVDDSERACRPVRAAVEAALIPIEPRAAVEALRVLPGDINTEVELTISLPRRSRRREVDLRRAAEMAVCDLDGRCRAACRFVFRGKRR